MCELGNFVSVLFWPQTFSSMQNFNFNIVKGLCDIWLQCAKSFQNPKLIWSCKTKLQLCQQSYTSEIWNEVNFSYGTVGLHWNTKKLFDNFHFIVIMREYVLDHNKDMCLVCPYFKFPLFYFINENIKANV